MTWLETNKGPPVGGPIKDLETIKLEYELIEFVSKATEELVKTVKRIKCVCTEFCRKVLLTYNQCQTSAKRKLEELPDHEIFLKQLQERWQEDEQAIQLVKGLDEKVLKIAIAEEAVSNHLLEDQLRLIPGIMVNIKSQAAKHEITIRFLEPSGFENIVADIIAWKKFMNEQVGPSQLDYFKQLINYVIYCVYLFLSPYARRQSFVKLGRLGEAQKAKRAVQDFLLFV